MFDLTKMSRDKLTDDDKEALLLGLRYMSFCGALPPGYAYLSGGEYRSLTEWKRRLK